ncbi:MAG: quinolinate synthase NadA [bacterium]|nr:quinolinate synthase NadA [bacterium]
MNNLPEKNEELGRIISQLKKEKNAVILAHYYQEPEIQDVADFVGDSLGLSQQAASTSADIIVFAGVHFMAETAKILNPDKIVLLPDLNAGCSLADSCSREEFKAFIDKHPGHVVVTYINCSAEIKALSDIVCTSSNAVQIINSIPADKSIIFAPDRNLGKYLMKTTGRDLLLWDGACEVHEAFSLEKIEQLQHSHPHAKLVAHPESDARLLARAHFIGSTTAMIQYIKNNSAREFIVATEAGILHQLRTDAPGKLVIPAPSFEANACACSECRYMKLNTLQKLYLCLKNESPEILITEPLRVKALSPIQRMLDLSVMPRETALS